MAASDRKNSPQILPNAPYSTAPGPCRRLFFIASTTAGPGLAMDSQAIREKVRICRIHIASGSVFFGQDCAVQAVCSVIGNQLLADSADSPFALALGQVKEVTAVGVEKTRLALAVCGTEAINLVVALRTGVIPADADQEIGEIMLHLKLAQGCLAQGDVGLTRDEPRRFVPET